MSQIRPTLSKALPEQLPPASWDSHQLEARAKKSIRHRRLGGGVLAVALLGLALVVSVTLFPRVMDVPAGDRKPGFPLPELSERQEYAWDFDIGPATDNTEKITDAFWDYLHEHHPELKTSSGYPDAKPDFARNQRQLWTAVVQDGMYDAGPETPGSQKVYQQPVYMLTQKGTIPFESERSESNESFSVTVYPREGYEPGTADISGEPELPPRPEYLVDGCEGFKKPDGAKNRSRHYAYTCTHPEAASGQETLAVDRTVDDYDDEVEYTRTVVLYRDDGTAVKISMGLTAPKPIEPGLSAAELLRIAEAIPDVPVA